MVLYAIVSIPLLLYLYGALGVLSLPLEASIFRRPIIKGAATAPVLAGILLLFSIVLEKQFSMDALFRYYLFRDTLIIPYLIALGSLVASRGLLDRGDWELFTAMIVYGATAYTLLALLDLVTANYHLGLYELFLKPTLRMVQLTLLSAGLITVIRQRGVLRWGALLLILLLPPGTAMVGAFEAAMRPIPAVVITVVAALAVAGAVYLGPALGYVREQRG